MKIVYLVNLFPKLSETFILNQITGLIDRGHEVEIIAFSDPKEKAIHEDIGKYQLLKKTHYLVYRDNFTLLDASNAKKLIPCLSADLVHAHFATESAEIAMEMNARIGIPYIVTVHAYDIFTQFDSKDLKTKLMKAEKVITCSQYNRNYLIDLLGDEVNQKLLVQPYGINVSRFDYPNRQPGEHVRVLFVGRLVPKKGVFDVLDAFGHVIEQFPSTELRIAGDGPLLEQAVQRVERSQLKDKVVFLGGLTQNDVIKEMKSADIFILPSKTAPDGDKEGLPVVILEAQAMGLPVVSTLHTGIPEEVLDGETAFLVPEGDVRSMADCLCRLIEEPDLRMQMGKRGREWVENRFNHKLELDNLEKIMLDVVSSRESSINKRINYYFPQVLEHLESQNPFRDWRRYFFRANRYLRKKAKKVIRFLNEQS